MRNQKIRDFKNARYAKYPHCYVCGKPILDYASHPMTDCKDVNGENIGDILLVLCNKCYKKTEQLKTLQEMKQYLGKL